MQSAPATDPESYQNIVKMSLQREVILNGNFKPKSELWFTRQKQKADEQWVVQFNKLKEYKEKYGDCMVPNSYTEDFSLRGEQTFFTVQSYFKGGMRFGIYHVKWI